MNSSQHAGQMKIIKYNRYLQMYTLTWVEFDFKCPAAQLLHTTPIIAISSVIYTSNAIIQASSAPAIRRIVRI